MSETVQDQMQDIPAGRALAIVQRVDHKAADRPMTDFLTQLIACDRRLPAYRRARKAEPADAMSAYCEHVPSSAASLDRSV